MDKFYWYRVVKPDGLTVDVPTIRNLGKTAFASIRRGDNAWLNDWLVVAITREVPRPRTGEVFVAATRL